jgi:hypothetical protein
MSLVSLVPAYNSTDIRHQPFVATFNAPENDLGRRER